MLSSRTDKDTWSGNKEIMEQIRLVVLGAPKAQERPRFFKKGDYIGSYDPSKTQKETFASVVQKQAPSEPISEAISIEMVFYMPRPKNHYGTGRKASLLKDTAPEYHTGTPDIDNLQKFVLDSLNKIFFRDDSLVCRISACKQYSEKPRTEIIISTIL